ncbi:MAG: UDP-N-acetylglucosamine 1-carboxyvinyltransferase [Clostridiales bacterium]|nr:UDP-N-acetylglucosamine 1-carboxyvinyltransferase [Clostridiales bacterium]
MEKYVISGGKTLNGDVFISGGKNAAVAIIPATVMVRGTCVIENMPNITDVRLLLSMLKDMGADVEFLAPGIVRVNCSNINSFVSDHEGVRKIRASYYFMGSLLGRFSAARVGLPGGCDFGVRPIDQHMKGFEALGAEISIEHGIVNMKAEKLVGTSIYLDTRSVGATINIMLAATLAEGTTVIENACREPHIVDTANFLNTMGADIKGAGTDVIKIKGVKSLHGGKYSIIPDQIEAGTYMVAAAATGGKVSVRNIIPKHMETVSAKLTEIGVTVEEFDDYIVVSRDPAKKLMKTKIKTMPYPGFPTDMQPQLSALLCLAEGTSIVTEGVWDNRFRYIEELRKLGAKADVDGKICVIEGVDRFLGAKVHACDLRAGAAMVIAGLCAEGITEVSDIKYVERGYENFVEKLRKLGANISKEKDDEAEPEDSKFCDVG